ncbi:MAG: hypothetical protein KTR24_11240 [Saprospiraceae bacterium]|nr:hypothetical protein [Saprospiraceae bacterium]
MNVRRFLILISFCMAGCVQQMDESLRQQLMDEALAERIKRYRDQKMKECHEETMAAALWAVDSAFRSDPILIELDSIDRPPPLQKPEKPPLVKPDRSIKLEPILKEEE